MNKSYFILFIAVLSVFSSCKKDDETGTGTESSSESYYPVTNGTQRTYKTTTATTAGTTSATITETFNGKTENYNGLTYYEAISKSAGLSDARNYHHESNGAYKLRSTTYVYGITIEFEFLRVNEAVGATWMKNVTASGTINGYPARMKGTMKEKNITKEVLGKSFNNVHHSTVELQYDFGTGFETAATYEFYVAKGIGTILIDSTVDMFGLKVISKTELQSYSVK